MNVSNNQVFRVHQDSVKSTCVEEVHHLSYKDFREEKLSKPLRAVEKVRCLSQPSVRNDCADEKVRCFPHRSNRILLDISSASTLQDIFNLYQESNITTLGLFWKIINIFFLLQVYCSPVSVCVTCTNHFNVIKVKWNTLFIASVTYFIYLPNNATLWLISHKATINGASEFKSSSRTFAFLLAEDQGLLFAGASSNYLHSHHFIILLEFRYIQLVEYFKVGGMFRIQLIQIHFLFEFYFIFAPIQFGSNISLF